MHALYKALLRQGLFFAQKAFKISQISGAAVDRGHIHDVCVSTV
ncbi:MAG: hypothetical protein ACJAXW_003187 [Candidatus Azotimanducaceae bacterium]|jgi:hypothetical protein